MIKSFEKSTVVDLEFGFGISKYHFQDQNELLALLSL